MRTSVNRLIVVNKNLRYVLPLAAGILMLFFPLVREFHFESALIAGTVGCFWGGWKASVIIRRRHLRIAFGILFKLALFGLPMFINSLIHGCLSWDGAGFWLLVPIPSVFFGVALGRFFRLSRIPKPRFFTISTLLIIALGMLVLELLTLPQVYFFNPVWGTWPGPIYDFEVEVTSSLFYFRAITLAWVILLWLLPHWSRSGKYKSAIITLAVLLSASFYFRPELGINTPNSYLKQRLHHAKETEHFQLYFDPELFTAEEMDYWALRHEFHFQQITEVLDIDWPENRMIESYLYANAWQKKKLVGAKYTSYVPVWLEQDQLHIAKEHLEGVLKHELVHVIAKQFGHPLTNASWSVGLVEGVAEAIAADASAVSTLDQIMAAEQPFPTAKDMKNALSFSGFYSSAGSISYTTAGSFVQFLLENYPVNHLKEAYQTSDFETAYPQPFDTLVAQWLDQLPVADIDSVDEETSQAIFAQQSLFQITCPHTQSPLVKAWEMVNMYELSNDSSAAMRELDALFTEQPGIPLIKQKWADYQLNARQPEAVIQAFSDEDSIPTFPLVKADAYLIVGRPEAANQLYQQTRNNADSSDVTLMESLEVRSNPLFWETFIRARYYHQLPTAEVFEQVPIQLKWLIIRRTLQHHQNEELVSFVDAFDEAELTLEWFEIELEVIDRLIFLDKFDRATKLIDLLQNQQPRERYIERLNQQREWLEFMRLNTGS